MELPEDINITYYRTIVKFSAYRLRLILARHNTFLRLKLEENAYLCYTTYTLENTTSTSSAPLCNQCGSKLIRITKKTKKIEGQKFPITVTTYKCSDKDCQKRIDKERQERLKKEEERNQKKQPRV